MRFITSAFVAVFTIGSLSAQTSDGGAGAALTPSTSASITNMHMTIRRNLIEAAEVPPRAAACGGFRHAIAHGFGHLTFEVLAQFCVELPFHTFAHPVKQHNKKDR